MNSDTIAGIYVYCMDFHQGQSSRLYRLMCKLQSHYKIYLTDRAINSISGNSDSNDWYIAQQVYHTLKAKGY